MNNIRFPSFTDYAPVYSYGNKYQTFQTFQTFQSRDIALQGVVYVCMCVCPSLSLSLSLSLEYICVHINT